MGWSKDSLGAGDHVVIKAHPPKDPSRAAALLISAQKADGTILSMADFAKAVADPGPALTGTHVGLQGTWATSLSETARKLFEDDAALKDRDLWPLTPAGAAAVASFHEDSDLPATECIPYTAPMLMLTPDVKSIEVRGDTIVIRGEFDDSERTVHMDATPRGGAQPSRQGRSIGRWEGSALVIDTRDFLEHRSGNNWSLPSSTRKHLVERLEPAEDGSSLKYRFELEDPQYLTRPVTGEAEWARRPDLSYAGQHCDPENARRFIPK